MSEQTNSSMFNLSFDHETTSQFEAAAKWARFLGIIGFVICGLIVIAALFAGTFISSAMSGLSGGMSSFGPGFGMMLTILYLLFAALYFFPSLFLYQFGVKMRKALANSDQAALNYSATKLKAFFRFWGILTIVLLSFYGLVIIFALASATLFN